MRLAAWLHPDPLGKLNEYRTFPPRTFPPPDNVPPRLGKLALTHSPLLLTLTVPRLSVLTITLTVTLTLTLTWSGCQLIYSDSSSLSSTLRLVWCFGFAAMTTSLTLSQFFIGCVYHNGSISRLRSWRSECCMVWLRHIWSWFVLLTCLVVALAAYVHQRNTS